METLSYKPKFGRVLIERVIQNKIGSLIIPNAQRIAKCEGTIIALGETAGWTETFNDNGDKIATQTLKVGDKVIFGRHSGAWLDATLSARGEENDDGKLFICQDADILCVINPSEEK